MSATSVVSTAYEHKATDAGMTEASIGWLLPAFYAGVRRDPIFAHIETVISFWLYATRLDRRYDARNFMPAHIKHTAIRAELISQWLALFRDMAQDLCPADSAPVLVEIAQRMASSLEISLNRCDGEAQ